MLSCGLLLGSIPSTVGATGYGISLESYGASPVVSDPYYSFPYYSFPYYSFDVSSNPYYSFPYYSFGTSADPFYSFPYYSFDVGADPYYSFPYYSFPYYSFGTAADAFYSFPYYSFDTSADPFYSFPYYSFPFYSFGTSAEPFYSYPFYSFDQTADPFYSFPYYSFPFYSFDQSADPFYSFPFYSFDQTADPFYSFPFYSFDQTADPFYSFPFYSFDQTADPFYSFPFYSFDVGADPFYSFPFYSFDQTADPFYSFPFYSFPFYSFGMEADPFYSFAFYSFMTMLDAFYSFPFYSFPFYSFDVLVEAFYSFAFYSFMYSLSPFYSFMEADAFYSFAFYSFAFYSYLMTLYAFYSFDVGAEPFYSFPFYSFDNQRGHGRTHGSQVSGFYQWLLNYDPELTWDVRRVFAGGNYVGDEFGDAEKVQVAVLDSGIDLDHPDLAANIAWTYDATGTGIDDETGHGTHVAGVIGATAGDGGIKGVHSDVEIYAVKVVTGEDMRGEWEWLEDALYASIRGPDGIIGTEDDADVINMSFGSGTEVPPQYIHDAIKFADSLGVVLVASGGNDGDGDISTSEANYPAMYPEVIAVGSTDLANKVSDFSNTGGYVEVVAPGDMILSTFLGGEYAYWGGTSMAAPHISGIVALLLAQHGNLPVGSFNSWGSNTIRGLLHRMAVDLGASGVDNAYGYGLVQYSP